MFFFYKDLQKWMDESKHGVVYFTLGSMVIIETLPKETLLAFYASFAKIAPIRVLMKIVNKEKLPPGLPSNVRTSNWISQIPILSMIHIFLIFLNLLILLFNRYREISSILEIKVSNY